MVMPELIDVIDEQLIRKWCDEVRKSDNCGFSEVQEKEKQALKEKLADEDKKLVDYLSIAVENKMDYIYFEACRKLFFFAFKAGMDFQKELDEE